MGEVFGGATIKTAEIIAIGDELVSGQRLDTNSQWLSRRLSEIGIEPNFHSCVGDSFDDGVQLFKQAAKRSQIIVCTGGIGPTKDDLTRQVIAKVASVELELHPEIEQHIRNIFASYGRQMPANNRIQAFFPAGSNVIPNSEGTAPGIDLIIGNARIFALPGVPYEMQEMWENYVQPQLLRSGDSSRKIKHHVVHCFGGGESQIELMLDGMTDRDHIPRVGITASKATISLRITALAKDENQCDQQIKDTVESIELKLGDLVFGCNGEELQDVVVALLQKKAQTLSICDYAFGGAASLALFKADVRDAVIRSGAIRTRRDWRNEKSIQDAARAYHRKSDTDFNVTISPTRKEGDERFYDVAVCDRANNIHIATNKYAGHSGLIEDRTVKQILNELRLHLR